MYVHLTDPRLARPAPGSKSRRTSAPGSRLYKYSLALIVAAGVLHSLVNKPRAMAISVISLVVRDLRSSRRTRSAASVNVIPVAERNA